MKHGWFSARDMARCALMAALMAVCSWITLPLGAVPLTLQTLGAALALGVLGGARGTAAIATYILLGAMGAPVFAGFAGGAGALMSPTGGYITGFACMGLVYWLTERLCGRDMRATASGMALGLMACYAFGTAWFALSSGATVWAALGACVAPFVLPDVAKLALALAIARRVRRHLRV